VTLIPTDAQLAWQRMGLGMFVHFGLNTFADQEWSDGTLPPTLFDPDDLDARQLGRYGYACGCLLARAHSQSPGARAVADYLDGSERFDEAVAAWAQAYADVCEADHRALVDAVASGRLPVADEVSPGG
jgi:hypothetical protein